MRALADCSPWREHASCWTLGGRTHDVEFASGPGGRQSGYHECDRIPVRAEGWAAIPSHRGADDAQRQADETTQERVLHGPIGSEARCYVAARDAVDNAIGSS